MLSSVGTGSGTNVTTIVASGRLTYRFKPPAEPFAAAVYAAGGIVRHAFERGTGGASEVRDRTHPAAVAGATGAFRLGARAGLVLGAEAYLYRARFRIGQPGSPDDETEPRTQNDLRITMGIRVPLSGQ